MPPPTGVVSGPLMPTRYWRKSARVWSGSHDPVLLNAFSPARTSCQWILHLPPEAFCTAASITRTEAFQMSGPVPSPSMKGMMGSAGTDNLPDFMVMAEGMGDSKKRAKWHRCKAANKDREGG